MGNKKETGMTRRQFCAASVIGSICLANMDSIAMAADKKQEELNADMVVIGAGGGGLTAAVSAYEAGIKNIVVLEKTAKPGGNTTNVGVFFAVNSPLQKRLGIKVTAEQAFREKMAHDHWRQNARLIRDTIEKSGEVLQWLENKGLKIPQIRQFAGEDAPQVGHDGGGMGILGNAILKILTEDCNKEGIKILFDAPAKKLLIDRKGSVTGVLASTRDKEFKITAKSVILASGGFAHNKELMKKYFPYSVDYQIGSVPQMTGDGLLMAEEIGAIIEDQMAILLVGGASASSSSLNISLDNRFDMIVVNKDGERYFDESISLNYNPDDSTNTLRRQRGKEYYALVDSGIIKDAQKGNKTQAGMGGMPVDLKDMPKGLGGVAEKKADTWEEIAEFIGADPNVLKETVERYNSFCKKGYDNDFFKDKKYLRPLNTPPYVAIRGRHGCQTTFGGIKINHRTEVLNNQDIPFKGLYAVGDCAGSWAPLTYSHRYPGSAGSFAVCSGFIAGENAAKYIKGNKI
jgi:fumarate reductase flavoprotein subunit